MIRNIHRSSLASALRYSVIACTLVSSATADACPLANGPSLAVHRFAQMHMGTTFRLTLYAASQDAAEEAAKAAFARIGQLDRMLSHYRDDSELSKLCRTSGSGDWVTVSDELWLMLEKSNDMSKRTDGAFDVTVGPLVQLWRRSRRRKELPDAELLRDIRQRVGFRAVDFEAAKQQVRLTKKDMRIDLGAIAKGYAADEALRVLKEHGINHVLIDAGGDLVAGDSPPGKGYWILAVAAYGTDDERKPPLLAIANAAVATSGDRFQFVEIDGRRYSHIIDPRSGLGITTPSSVTVIARDGVTADSLASAVSVLGPATGLKLIEETPDAAALVSRQEPDGVREYRSKRISKWFKQSVK